MKPVATCADDLTADWVSNALGIEVRSVRAERIGAGQTSSAYRLTIDADDCAPSLVAKLAEGDEAGRRRVATGHRNEVGFYTRLAGTLEVRVPICWYGALSNDATEFTLILEDLAPRRPGRQVDGCSRDQAANAVRNLAALHASRWNDPSLREIDFLIPLTKERAEFLGQLGSTATEQFIARFASRLADAEVATLRDVADALVDWQLSRPEPVAVMHGDYRLDNLMFPPVGDDVVAVDWQTVTAGLPARDLSYLLGTSLRIEDRRVAEDAIVGSYHHELRARGVEGYTSQQCFEDYRVGHLQGPMITVLGCMTAAGRSPAGDEMFMAMAHRSCAAIRDLKSLDCI